MIPRKYHIAAISFVFLCLFCFGMGRIAFAQKMGPSFDGTQSLEEKNLLDLINQARKNPLQMAASIGLDPNKILQDLPELKEILTQGLPALEFDKSLYNAANAHAEDMLASNYYSHDSLDGSSYDDRIRKTGYTPLSTGESLGFLAFNNFIEPGYAAQVIFEKIYKEELDPSRTAARNILNPALNEAGVSLVAGVFVSSGAPWNAYMAVVDFADSFDLYAVKKGLWRLINDARKSPLNALNAAGIDEAWARDVLGNDDWVLNQGLPPLSWNEKLEASAVGHYSDMYTCYYYDTSSQGGSTAAERIASTGYEPVLAGEALGNVAIYESTDPAKIASMIFNSMLRAEFNPEIKIEKFIFAADPREIGLACGKVYTKTEEGSERTVFIVVADFAQPYDPQVFLIGNVYEDQNEDLSYDPGEGVEGLTVSVGILGQEGRFGVKTDPLGNYQVEIVQGFLDIAVQDDSGKMLQSDVLLWLENKSLMMDLRIELDETVVVDEKQVAAVPTPRTPSLAITW